MNLITKEMIRSGIKANLVEFVVDPNFDGGTVCKIGDGWFYFGGLTAEELSPEEYKKNVPLDDIVEKIYVTLNDFANYEEFWDEYDYYEAILLENQIMKEE